MAAAFAVVCGLFLLRGWDSWPVPAALSAAFALAALLLPRALAPVERGWMRLAHLLGRVVTTVLLTVVFFLVITPLGLVMRLLGRDPMMLRSGGGRESYWRRVDPGGPGSRPERPY